MSKMAETINISSIQISKIQSITNKQLNKDKISNMTTLSDVSPPKDFVNDLTSSTVSLTSSLASPGDSGVQMLDSESEITSIMSMSGHDIPFDTKTINQGNTYELESDGFNCKCDSNSSSPCAVNRCSVVFNEFQNSGNISVDDSHPSNDHFNSECDENALMKEITSYYESENVQPKVKNRDDICYETLSICSSNTVSSCPMQINNSVSKENDLKIHDTIKTLHSDKLTVPSNVMTSSDIANQNTTPPFYDYNSCMPISSQNFENIKSECSKVSCKIDQPKEEHFINNKDTGEKNIKSENSPALDIDFSLNDEKSDLETNHAKDTCYHVNNLKQTNNVISNDNVELKNNISSDNNPQSPKTQTNLTSELNIIPDDQIVYRRQRRKKSKGHDTPKKRVSFHEDILNSTKIDDIHIDRGFVTRQGDISLGFFNQDSYCKKGVVVGRYSWAAEGDSPYYQSAIPEREVKSDIYVNNFYGSNSSSSSISLESCTSSNSSDESLKEDHAPSVSDGIKNIKKVPKSSCLKKPKSGRKFIDTNIVQEENLSNTRRNLSRKISESNILDSNIFGSLKNIYKSLSSSVPLAERGVPEGQEDCNVYSSTQNLSCSNNCSRFSNESLTSKSFDDCGTITPSVTCDQNPEEINSRNIYKKPNLRLSRSEGFYPNYPSNTENVPQNIILCDSNVYEHKGISYSYEFDQFQNSFHSKKKHKSSTVYQMLLKDLFFSKRSEYKSICKDNNKPDTSKETKGSSYVSAHSSPVKKQTDPKLNNYKYGYNFFNSDTTSDSDTISDLSEKPQPSKHLQSPLKKRNQNNSLLQNNLKLYESMDTIEIVSDESKSSDSFSIKLNVKQTPKTTLINRFLRNVTQKKLLDAKLHKSKLLNGQKNGFKLYIEGIKYNPKMSSDLDDEINREIKHGIENKIKVEHVISNRKIKNEIFRDENECLYKMYDVFSAYNSSGETKPLTVLLTNTTLYIAGFESNKSYKNYFVLLYNDIRFIIIGPCGHTIYFSNSDSDMQFIIVTANSNLTCDLVGNIEISMQKNVERNCSLAVKWLSIDDMVNLRRSILLQTPIAEDEDFYYYGIVNVQDDNITPTRTPLGPFKEGFLMYRYSSIDKWEFGYFILKGGVLYTLTNPSQRVPIDVTELRGGACHGVHRTPPRPRPHTFEVLCENRSFEFAASDEYEVSEWSQLIIQSASESFDYYETTQTHACSLLISSDHIVTVREAFYNKSATAKALSCAAISDLITLKCPNTKEFCWCVLEFSCREVHESTGDWIIYFTSSLEYRKFISTLEVLWSYNNAQGDAFPLIHISDSDPLSCRCKDTMNASDQIHSMQSVFIL